ncbi:helix-turn-helix domain-containing protein [Escherichia coli]|nr:helix-turn-helix domain-containing protein [Escherichia coli]EIM2921392.1 helix-turn-helix domain-containing protein [Escherichia coli]EIM2940901.1 helix-turn-helix domain-containing protein [Escherichia coli]EIM2960382.1 helix-turn-helix domain-containing protein [Escherichia coli]
MAECQAIGRSIAKYTHRNFTPAIQAAQGRKGGIAKGAGYEDKRCTALEMLANGYSQKAIAEMLGVSDRTIRNWKSGK